jgi:hypothetical protein
MESVAQVKLARLGILMVVTRRRMTQLGSEIDAVRVRVRVGVNGAVTAASCRISQRITAQVLEIERIKQQCQLSAMFRSVKASFIRSRSSDVSRPEAVSPS